MQYIILGEMGTGKTQLVTYFSLASKVPCLSNYKVGKFETIDEERRFIEWQPNFYELKIDELFNLPYKKCKVLLDEAYAYIESRVSMSKLNLYCSYVLFQSRKRGIDFFLTAQLSSTIDHRFIDLADMIVVCKQINEGFYYGFWYRKSNSFAFMKMPFKTANKIWQYYDTTEVVQPPRVDELQAQISIMDKTKLKQKIDALEVKFYKVYPDCKKATIKMINSFLLDIGESEEYSEYLYGRLQLNSLKGVMDDKK